jgi:hypothetical protein
MKNSTFILVAFILLFSFHKTSAQEKRTIVFSHGKSGKLTERKLQVSQGARLGKTNSPVDTSKALNFKIFPNPTNTTINIEGELPENVSEAQVSVLNLSGQVLKKDTYTGQAKAINVEDLKSGMYLLELIYSKKKKETYKIIITN